MTSRVVSKAQCYTGVTLSNQSVNATFAVQFSGGYVLCYIVMIKHCQITTCTYLKVLLDADESGQKRTMHRPGRDHFPMTYQQLFLFILSRQMPLEMQHRCHFRPYMQKIILICVTSG